MSKTHKHSDGKEYPLKSGKLYYLTSRQEYELYHGQWQDTHGEEMAGVSVVTGEYFYADVKRDDGSIGRQLIVARVFRSDASGAITEHASEDVLRAEIARQNQLIHSLQAEVKALREQNATQQVSIVTSPVLNEEVIHAPVVGDGFGSQLEQAMDAQARVGA